MSEDAPSYDTAWDPWGIPRVMPKRDVIDVETYRQFQSEKAFMAAVREAAQRLGWLDFHIPNAMINPPGWPDLLLLRNGEVIFAELKLRKGRIGPRQHEMAMELAGAGFPVRLWYPDMWDEIEAALRGGA